MGATETAETPTTPPKARSRALNWVDYALGLGFGAAFVIVLMLTMDMGYVRDEGFYFRAAFHYLGWFKELGDNIAAGQWASSFDMANIDKHWAYNQEHPVLPKALFALSHWLFAETLGWMNAGTAMRFVGALFSGGLVTMVYLFCAEAFGRWQAVFAVLATAAMPRPFFHAHLACFDAPVSTMWFFVMVCWWKSLKSTGWGWATGIAFGVALSIKHNIFFLPPLFVLHWLLLRGHQFRLMKVEGRWRIQLPPMPVAFVSMATLGPLVWYVLWPSHWFDTFNRIAWYFSFHLKHVHYFQYYFGENLYEPPFPVAFPFMMSAVTMPPATIAAFVLGAAILVGVWLRTASREGAKGRWVNLKAKVSARFEAVEPDERGTGWWLFLGILVPFAVIAQPSTPVFGGIKHWMPAMPFMAIVAGVGAVWAGRTLASFVPEGKGRLRAWVVAGFLALLLAPAITATVHNHPHGTAFYNVLIGGPRGAADAKMMRQFWGFSGKNALPFLNEKARDRAPVFFQNTNWDSYDMYKRVGLLRPDIAYGRMPSSDYGMIHHQMAARSLELDIWKRYNTRNPAFVADTDGVPVLSVYPNTRRLRTSAPKPAQKTP